MQAMLSSEVSQMRNRFKRCRFCPRNGGCRFGCELLDNWETSAGYAKQSHN